MKIGDIMKKNNAFTMVEMLGVVAILGIILLIAVPSLINSLKSSERKAYEDFIKDLYLAAESYVQHNYEEFYPNQGEGRNYVTLEELINEGYLNGNLVNPNTDEPIRNEASRINLTKEENGVINYDYVYMEGE
jgi:prepilin-type N-terminal cleavage/methylation domain-containing protein